MATNFLKIGNYFVNPALVVLIGPEGDEGSVADDERVELLFADGTKLVCDWAEAAQLYGSPAPR